MKDIEVEVSKGGTYKRAVLIKLAIAAATIVLLFVLNWVGGNL